MESFHILWQLLDTSYAIVYNTLPLLQLTPCHSTVREQQWIARILLNGLRVVSFGALIVTILEAGIPLDLELFSGILVSNWHHGQYSKGILALVKAEKCDGSGNRHGRDGGVGKV